MADMTLTAHNRPMAHRMPAWWRRAACRGNSPAVFYLGVGYDEGRAKRICSSCTVRACCLAFALEHEEPLGIWGGLNPTERQALAHAGVVLVPAPAVERAG